jgi:hypothetical protein
MQKRKYSFIESITNTAVGFLISLGIQILIYPALDITVSLQQNLLITTIFTIASIGRGYILRKIFNKVK